MKKLLAQRAREHLSHQLWLFFPFFLFAFAAAAVVVGKDKGGGHGEDYEVSNSFHGRF